MRSPERNVYVYFQECSEEYHQIQRKEYPGWGSDRNHILATSCIALAIRSSAGEIVSSYEDSFEITASLSVDREALRDLMMSQSEGSRGSWGSYGGN